MTAGRRGDLPAGGGLRRPTSRTRCATPACCSVKYRPTFRALVPPSASSARPAVRAYQRRAGDAGGLGSARAERRRRRRSVDRARPRAGRSAGPPAGSTGTIASMARWLWGASKLSEKIAADQGDGQPDQRDGALDPPRSEQGQRQAGDGQPAGDGIEHRAAGQLWRPFGSPLTLNISRWAWTLPISGCQLPVVWTSLKTLIELARAVRRAGSAMATWIDRAGDEDEADDEAAEADERCGAGSRAARRGAGDRRWRPGRAASSGC